MAGVDKAVQDEQFAEFVGRASTSLNRTAWLLTGSTDRAAELVQASLVKTYLAWERVRPGEALAYARRTLVNHNIDTWRSTRGEQLTDVFPETGSAPRRHDFDAVDERDLATRLLDLLPPQQRRVVVLRYYCDLSEAQVAETLGVSTGAVKSAASRGLAVLREHLETSGSTHLEGGQP